MKRYLHNLSHYHLFTGDMGTIIPAALVEVMPGDTFRWNTTMLVRCAPLVAPVMHPVQVRIHHFFVPNRITWTAWGDFVTGAWEGQVPNRSVPDQPLPDYLGLPGHPDPHEDVNELPFRAYQMIYNEFYRDQEISEEVALGSTELQRCAWEKDHITGARLYRQRGADEAFALVVDNQVTATRLREALAEQRFLEARSRYGNRYTEWLQYHGITPSDARLQRPEYLGGGRQTISFSEVLQTVATDDAQVGNPLGHMGGHGIAAVRAPRFEKFFEEHGFVLTLVSVRPKAIYMEGVQRKWRKIDHDDLWQKEHEHTRQDTVRLDEVQSDPGDSPDRRTEVFGFSPKNYDLSWEQSRVSGEFRTSTMSHWHLAREFQTKPNLDETFITCNPTKRIFADQNAHGLYFMANHSIQAKRIVKRNPTPRTI